MTFTPITISELLDGTLLGTRNSVMPFDENSITLKRPSIQQPDRLIYAQSYSQLELDPDLGTNLEIPDNESLCVLAGGSFTIPTSFKLGLNSTLQIITLVPDVIITCTGTGGMFQMENPANPIKSIIVKQISLAGDGTNSLLDVTGTGIVDMIDVQIAAFDSIGTINIPFYLFTRCLYAFLGKGLIAIDAIGGAIIQAVVNQIEATGITLLTVITKTVPTNITIDKVRVLPGGFFAGDSLLNFGKCSPDESIFFVTLCDAQPGDLYTVLSDQAINAMEDEGGGQVRVTTTGSHNIPDGQCVELLGFASSNYNNNFVIESTGASDQFLITAVFDGDQNGFFNASSRNQTDVQVNADKNEGSRDSMWTAETGFELFGSPNIGVGLAQNVPAPINIGVPWGYNGLERISKGVENEGEIVIEDPKERSYLVTYSATIEKTSGPGAINIGIVILKNGDNVSFDPPHSESTTPTQIQRTNKIIAKKPDVLKIARINYDATDADIGIAQAHIELGL